MVYPMWTFGLALGVGIAIFAYQQYEQYNRRQRESSYRHERPQNNNFSDHNSWQPQEPINSEGSRRRRTDLREDVNQQNKTEENGAVVVEEVEYCQICSEPLRSNFRSLDCRHTFHAACLIERRRIMEVCPVCKVTFC